MLSTMKPPYLGAAYYPEDWPMEQVDQDIALMKQAGMNVMRIGEFAWSRMEPTRGAYDFDWLHTIVDKLAAAGIATIMCTPTATPPAWLTSEQPECLAVSTQGRQAQHGARRHPCPNNRTYRDHCRRIAMKMAEQFADDPNVIGWQIDNEVSPYARHGCACPACQAAFKDHLREKFGSIEALNQAWCLHLWSQDYNDFDQIPIPFDGNTWHNPHLEQAWMDFQSHSYCDFILEQADVLHSYNCKMVGTDMMPFTFVDYPEMFSRMDVVQFNHYNTMDNLWQVTFWMDYCRNVLDKPFWNTETSTCWNGSTAANGYREPGFCRVNSWLPLALGGEANLYWLWRSHWAGHELMHGSVVSSCGRPLHIFGEVQAVSEGFEKSAAFLQDAPVAPSGLAMHYSSQAGRMFDAQCMVNGFKYLPALMEDVYQPLLQANLRPDVIDPSHDLSGYKVVFTPFLPSLSTGDLIGKIKPFVENGGTWIVGPLSDVRDAHGAKFTHAPYGVLEDWLGVYTDVQIPGDPRQFDLVMAGNRRGQGKWWYDGYKVKEGTRVLATYTQNELAGLGAIVERQMGKGRVILLGTLPQGEALTGLVREVAQQSGVRIISASDSVLAVPRQGERAQGMVVVELGHQVGFVDVPNLMTDLITGGKVQGRVPVKPYQVLVLQA